MKRTLGILIGMAIMGLALILCAYKGDKTVSATTTTSFTVSKDDGAIHDFFTGLVPEKKEVQEKHRE